jgi:hypothetical protein
MTFRIGQKVVCVDASDGVVGASMFSDRLVKGNIYTIRGFNSPDYLNDTLGLLLEEIIGEISTSWDEEYGFRQNRFRPIVERKTDISVFTAMLTDKRVDA